MCIANNFYFFWNPKANWTLCCSFQHSEWDHVDLSQFFSGMGIFLLCFMMNSQFIDLILGDVISFVTEQ